MFVQVPGAPCLFRRLDCFDGGVAVAEDEQPGGLCAPWAGLRPEHAGIDRGELCCCLAVAPLRMLLVCRRRRPRATLPALCSAMPRSLVMLVRVRVSPVPACELCPSTSPVGKADDLWCNTRRWLGRTRRSMLRRRWRCSFLHAVPAGRRGTSAARSFRTPSPVSYELQGAESG